jgi:glycosyltransferase involved in cell wall biosynthesis
MPSSDPAIQPDLTVVVPVLDEEQSLPELGAWIARVLQENNLSYEVILVDDGSSDGSWEQIVKLNGSDPRFKGIRFNRNFGKSAALQTGFRASTGRVVVTLDADLQDSPDEIPALYNMIHYSGFHIVSGWKKKRHDPLGKTLPSRLFNRVTRWISGIQIHDFNCGLKAYQSAVVKNITVYGEMHRYIPVIARWAGFSRITEKVVAHQARKYGKSKYGVRRLLTGFLDLMSVTFVGRFRRKPMHFFGTFGVLFFLLGFLFTAKIFWDKIDSLYLSGIPLKRDIAEQPLFYLALVSVVIGVQLFLTGFLAEMMALQSLSKREYLIIDRVGIESKEKDSQPVMVAERA